MPSTDPTAPPDTGAAWWDEGLTPAELPPDLRRQFEIAGQGETIPPALAPLFDLSRQLQVEDLSPELRRQFEVAHDPPQWEAPTGKPVDATEQDAQ